MPATQAAEETSPLGGVALQRCDQNPSQENRRRLFTLEDGFRLAAEEMGWPEERRKKADAASTKTSRKSRLPPALRAL